MVNVISLNFQLQLVGYQDEDNTLQTIKFREVYLMQGFDYYGMRFYEGDVIVYEGEMYDICYNQYSCAWGIIREHCFIPIFAENHKHKGMARDNSYIIGHCYMPLERLKRNRQCIEQLKNK